MRVRGLWVAGERAVGWVGLGVLLTLVLWWWYALAIQGSPGDWAFDFRQFWQGGSDVVNGVSPYPSAALLDTAGDHLDPEGIREVFRFPYPAGAAVALAPFGALEFHAAAAIWSALLIVSLLAAIWIVGVRDWRVLAIVVSSSPAISSVRLGTFTPVLVLLIAVAWRWRDRRWISGGSLAVAISLKIFLWPLVVWLVATRRYAAAAMAAGLAAALTLGAWATIGFDGLADYPDLVRKLSDVVAGRSFSLVALGLEAGLPRGVADALPWAVGLGLLAGVAVFARRADGDRVAFSLAVAAAIALTPIVWLHYFVLLVVPVAIFRPKLAWVWALFWLFWLTPYQTNGGNLWRIIVVDGVVAALIVSSIALYSRGQSEPGSR